LSFLSKKEDARIEKSNGQVIGPYKAVFAGNTIIIADQMADIEEGDTILRKLPNGRDERSIVTSATFYSQGVSSLGPHYQVKFRKGGDSPVQKPTQHINITGAQSVQIGDYNTQNIINSFEALVKQIEATPASSIEKEEAKSRLRAFLTHPLVVSVLGAVAGAVVG
jgi:hypothetical protein